MRKLSFATGLFLIAFTACSGYKRPAQEPDENRKQEIAEIPLTQDAIETADEILSNPEAIAAIYRSLSTSYYTHLPNAENAKIKNTLTLSGDSTFRLSMYNIDQQRFLQEPLTGTWVLSGAATVTFFYNGRNQYINHVGEVNYDSTSITFKNTPSGTITYQP